MTTKPGGRYNGQGQINPNAQRGSTTVDIRFDKLDDYERLVAREQGWDPSDVVAMIAPAIVAPQVQVNAADGSLLFTVTTVIPPGAFEGQRGGAIVGPDGKPALDLSKFMAPVVPQVRFLVKRSGMTAQLREHPAIKAVGQTFLDAAAEAVAASDGAEPE